ncbi:MAG: IclR family transcriptional regulator [Armatimonadota bacterium]
MEFQQRQVTLPGDLPRTATIQSISKAIRVLKSFTKAEPERAVTALSRALGWHKAVVHKILITLERDRLVQQDPTSRRYRLGPGIMELAGVFLNEEPLTREGTPLLKELAQMTQHTATLAVLDGLEVVYVAAAEGAAGLRMTARAGDRRQAYATASGKVLLCELPADVLDRLLSQGPLQALTPHTIVDPNRLKAHLRQVLARGFAINMEERIDGMVGVAAPVRDHRGATVAAISVGFARQLRVRDAVDEAIRQVVASANELSRRLGAPADCHIPERTSGRLAAAR